MIRRFLDRQQADQLLSGARPPAGEPTADVANVLGALRTPADPAELAGTEPLIARMAGVARTGGVPGAAHSGRSTFARRLLTAKVAALAAACVVGAGAVAAATGSLPSSVEDGLKKVGWNVSGDDSSDGSGSSRSKDSSPDTSAFSTGALSADESSPTSVPQGPDLAGPAKKGLCNAYRQKGEKNMEATAFANLRDAATKKDKTIEEFCADVLPPGKSGSTPADTAPGQAGDNGNGKGGKSDDGSTPADTAPGQTGDKGNGTGGRNSDDESKTADTAAGHIKDKNKSDETGTTQDGGGSGG